MAQQEKDPGLRVSENACGELTAPVYETMTVERKQPISVQDSFDHPPPPGEESTAILGQTPSDIAPTVAHRLSRVRTMFYPFQKKQINR